MGRAATEAQNWIRVEWARQESRAFDEVRRTMIVNDIPDKSAFINAVSPLHTDPEVVAVFGDLIERIKAVR